MDDAPQHADLLGRLAEIDERVRSAAIGAGRDSDSVRILLATKRVTAERIAVAVRAGFRLIGENRVQELTEKYDDLVEFRPDTHLIGHLQSNKVNSVVGRVSCVQSVDSLEIAERLNRRATTLEVDLDVLVQVNVSGEDTKSGVAPADTRQLVEALASLDRLRHRGYMTIGLNSPDLRAVRAGYDELTGLRDDLLSVSPTAVELSMGMSGDFETAIEAGATMVRVGSAVFGERAR